MRRTLMRFCLLAGLTLTAGGCSGQHWGPGPLVWMGPSPMYRRVPPGSTGRTRVVVTSSRTPATRRSYAPLATERRPTPARPAAAGDPAWQVARSSRPWRYVIIHHSATAGGNAAQFDTAHRNRGWDELGYHFVIDNGNGGPNGRVEVGSRWPKQKHGAHTGGTPDNEYNEVGIGICLVGDFSRRLPSSAQLAALDRLVAYLAETYDIPPENVITHRDAPGGHITACPGGLFHAYVHGGFKASLRLKLASTCPAWRKRVG